MNELISLVGGVAIGAAVAAAAIIGNALADCEAFGHTRLGGTAISCEVKK